METPDSTRHSSDSEKIFTVESMSWGKTFVSGELYKDVRIYSCPGGGGVEEWNWGTTGTRHVPGIQEEDVRHFLDHVEIVVLYIGMEEKLQVKPETLSFLFARGKGVYVMKSDLAVEKYNELAAKGFSVGALIHSTC